MPTYVYSKALGRCVLKEKRQEVEAPNIRAQKDTRFISQRSEPNLGRGTAHAAPYYVDGQPAFNTAAQAEEFGAAHGMVYDRDRPTASEHRAEMVKRSQERKAAKAARRMSTRGW